MVLYYIVLLCSVWESKYDLRISRRLNHQTATIDRKRMFLLSSPFLLFLTPLSQPTHTLSLSPLVQPSRHLSHSPLGPPQATFSDFFWLSFCLPCYNLLFTCLPSCNLLLIFLILLWYLLLQPSLNLPHSLLVSPHATFSNIYLWLPVCLSLLLTCGCSLRDLEGNQTWSHGRSQVCPILSLLNPYTLKTVVHLHGICPDLLVWK